MDEDGRTATFCARMPRENWLVWGTLPLLDRVECLLKKEEPLNVKIGKVKKLAF